MKKNELVNLLTEFCELENEDFTLETIFTSINGYDSLALMSIIAFVDENFDLSLTASQLSKLTDFNSLIELIGEDKFEND
uniref:acyl carrier protein n=1 Tax=Algoriphagus sp. TaxID=1872435 RepID=UPI00404810CD